jgi:hypothetical protein
MELGGGAGARQSAKKMNIFDSCKIINYNYLYKRLTHPTKKRAERNPGE